MGASCIEYGVKPKETYGAWRRKGMQFRFFAYCYRCDFPANKYVPEVLDVF